MYLVIEFGEYVYISDITEELEANYAEGEVMIFKYDAEAGEWKEYAGHGEWATIGGV